MTELFKERAKLKTVIRSFFSSNEYLEIDTPILVQMPGAEIHLDYFATNWLNHQGSSRELFLRSSPEVHMKRALATGLQRIFQFAPSFRNGGEFSNWHHPEFLMLEWYEIGMTFTRLIEQTAELIRAVSDEFGRNLNHPVPIHSVSDLFKEFAGLDPFASDFLDTAIDRKLTNVNASDDNESAFFKIMLDVIEPELARMGACFVHSYPASTASLAAVENNRALRVELYLQGVEVANGFQELQGSTANRKRLQSIYDERQRLGKQPTGIDVGFIEDMDKVGSCAGNALGFDRLLAWALGRTDLAELIPFREDFLR